MAPMLPSFYNGVENILKRVAIEIDGAVDAALDHRGENQVPLPGDDFANIIELSEAFYLEIQQHKISVERKVVAALANAPARAISTYGWSEELDVESGRGAFGAR